MKNISSRFRLNESQCIRPNGEVLQLINDSLLGIEHEFAAAASLLMAFVTIGYLLRKKLEHAFASQQGRYLKQSSQDSGRRQSPSSSKTTATQVQADKILYHKLQNLSSNPECLSQARIRLLELLDRTVHEALATPNTAESILSIPQYSPEALHGYLNNAANATAERFAQYTARRKDGGPREMLPTLEYAKYWIRLAAPVKYVDGSWLGGIHRLSTTEDDYRAVSRVAWQILSEELGDGDIGKNHVAVYKQLINATGNSSIGLGHESRFISNVHNPNYDARVWAAGVSQLLVSLFPDEMLPEMLGFNMAYESLPCHLLITIQELQELRLDPYYFILHVSIDNGHSGHAAMGAAAVTRYIDSLKTKEERELAWKRVQTGYIMAEGLPTTPSPISDLDRKVKRIFEQKCETSKPMHTFCNGNIGGVGGFGKKLTKWLDPERFDDWGFVFVKTIADSQWVEKGDPSESKLVKELKWGGRMFGAYTSDEVRIIEEWIAGLKIQDTFPESKGAYKRFTGKDILSIPLPYFPSAIRPSSHLPNEQRGLRETKNIHDLLDLELPEVIKALPSSVLGTLLMLSATPFEYFPSYPSHISTAEGMAALRTLRALYGFLPEDGLCAGMDEVFRSPDDVIGVIEVGRRLGGKKPLDIGTESTLGRLCEYVTKLSRYPADEVSRLLGCQIGFLSCVLTNESGLWDGAKGKRLTPKESNAMKDIGRRIVEAWKDILTASNKEHSRIKWEEVLEGWNAVVSSITEIVWSVGEGDTCTNIKGHNHHMQQTDSKVDLMINAVRFTDDIRGMYTSDCGLNVRTKHLE